MKTRKFLLPLAMIALLLASAGSVFAQDFDQEPCLGLDEADCELYYGFQETGLPESTAFDLTVDGRFDAEGDTFEFGVSASGAYVLDAAAATAAADAFGEVSVLDVSPRDFIELADGTVSAFDAELSLDINGIPGVSDMTGGEPFPTIDLWLVDGVAYADLTILGNLMGDPSLAGVYGLDVFDITTTLLEDVTLADLLPEDMGMGGMDDMGGMGMMGPQEAFTQGFTQGFNAGMALSDEDIASFATLTRLDDEEADGMTLAVFQTEVDVSAVFDVPAIRQQIIASIEAQDTSLPGDVSTEEFVDALARALEGSTTTVIERYDMESGYLVSSEITSTTTVDPAPFAELEPEGFTGEEQPINVTLTINFVRSNINGVEAIELPEGAQVVPPEALFGGMMPQS